MKASFLRLSAFALFALVLAACDSAETTPPPPPPATTGTLTGVISLPPGTNGSVANTRVALFASIVDYFNDSFAYQTAADANGNYTIANIVPGTYFMEAWKDNNNNQAIGDTGDFYGIYGTLSGSSPQFTPVSIPAGQTVTISFPITQCPPGGCFQ